MMMMDMCLWVMPIVKARVIVVRICEWLGKATRWTSDGQFIAVMMRSYVDLATTADSASTTA